MATQLANRTTGAVSDELIERAHQRADAAREPRRHAADHRRRRLQRPARGRRASRPSPLGARDVARPGQFAALEHHGLENEPPYPVEDDQPGAR